MLLTGLFFMTTGAMTATNLAIDLPIVTIGVAAWMGVLIRSGLLASAAFILVVMIDQFAVLTLDFSNWYAGRSFVFLSLVVAVFGYAFYISLGGKRVLPQSG